MEIVDCAEKIVNVLSKLGAKNVEALDISEKSKDIKLLVICSLKTEDKVKEVATNFMEEAKGLGLELLRKDGLTKGQWVVLDYNEVLIEIFFEPLREKYNLEKLWKDGKNKLFPIENKKTKKPAKTPKKWHYFYKGYWQIFNLWYYIRERWREYDNNHIITFKFSCLL